MKSKSKLLQNLLSGEKQRHKMVATVTSEGEWNQHEPNSGMARVFVLILLAHFVGIGWMVFSDFGSDTIEAPQAPAAAAMAAKQNDPPMPTAPAAAAAPAAEPIAAASEPYHVQSGDSVPAIAAKLRVDRDELIKLNKLDQDVQLTPGMALRVPANKVEAPLAVATAQQLPAAGLAPPSAASVALQASSAAANAGPALAASSTVVALPAASSATMSLALPDDPPATTSELPAVGSISNDPSLNTASGTAVSPSAKAESAKPKAAPIAPSQPHPVPKPSEMAKRPVTKADQPPTTAKKADKGSPPPSTAAAKSSSHVMAKGETLYGIARKHKIPVDALIKANSIKDPAKLRDGTKLVIPGK